VGNRKQPNRRVAGATRAPADPRVTGEAEPGPAPRSAREWTVLSLKVAFGLGLLVAAVVTLAWGVHRYAQTTPRFAIVHLEVEGTKRLAREDVLGAAGVQKGQNLFSLDIPKAERALVESPWISSAHITRRLPGTVRLQVVERDPRAILVLHGKNFLVSSDGTPFKELGQGDPHDFPLITGVSAAELRRDRRAELERLERTLALLRQYEELPLGRSHPVQEVHLTDSGSASLTVGELGLALHLGAPPWKQKLLRAERVLSKAERAGGTPQVVFLDNDAHPERVVMRVQ
jgi:cell division protein FtsQ